MLALSRRSVMVVAWAPVRTSVSMVPKSPFPSAASKGATHLEFCAARHHLLETNTHALDNCQQHRASDGAIPRRLEPTPYRQSATRQETRADGVPRVLFLPDALDGAVGQAEDATPGAEVAA